MLTGKANLSLLLQFCPSSVGVRRGVLQASTLHSGATAACCHVRQKPRSKLRNKDKYMLASHRQKCKTKALAKKECMGLQAAFLEMAEQAKSREHSNQNVSKESALEYHQT